MKVDIQALKARLTYNNRHYFEVAESIGVSRDTFRKKLQNGDFKISEIHKLMEKIPLTTQDVQSIFFAD